ncbi:MAG TPA: DUF4097 family beta strand repeat-containing protein [Candidatus Acidoferrum sp.]|nr:DUF4097 family beta strand repeat-containing protein [Candidatus Acidoferrum sp.]
MSQRYLPGLLRGILLAVLLAAVNALPGFALSKNFSETVPLQPGGSFELQNVNGTVEVQGWDRDEIEIRAVKTAKEKESDLDRVSIDVTAQPRAVFVATRYPQNEGVEVAVEYTVHVPRNAHVERLATVNGTLRISSLENVGDLRTVNGNIEVYESGGPVAVHVTNGNVHLELSHLREQDPTFAETTNGSVLLALPANTQADLEARCLNGTFSSELPVTVESTQRPREVRGKLGKGGAPIKLRTVNGGIQIAILRSTV